MLDKDVILNEIRSALDNMLENVEADDLNALPQRTEQVLAALCRWGLKRGLWAGAANMRNREDMQNLAQENDGSIGNEWLYDFTCLKYNLDDWLKKIVLVAECEWGNWNEIMADFEKLLLARAYVRVMIFDGQQSSPPETVQTFRRYIKKCKHTRVGDTYLFAALLHDGEPVNYRFDYHLSVA